MVKGKEGKVEVQKEVVQMQHEELIIFIIIFVCVLIQTESQV
jgi:hypothetical protein